MPLWASGDPNGSLPWGGLKNVENTDCSHCKLMAETLKWPPHQRDLRQVSALDGRSDQLAQLPSNLTILDSVLGS